jgi:hypothetical protein
VVSATDHHGRILGFLRTKQIRTQINGKFSGKSVADENKNILLWSLYLKTIRTQYIYSSIEDSEVVLVFERNVAC